MELNIIINADCMDVMKDIPDKWFELAIVDPPYGIGRTWNKNKYSRHKNNTKSYKNETIPSKEYFNELSRISKNQIIWGANYFNILWPTKNVIIWDKVCKWEKQNMGEAEIAITTLNHRPISIYKHQWTGALKGSENGKIKTIHPHQKPVALYRWLLQNYAKLGDKIIDTHSGSASCAIACYLEGYEFLSIEKDYDYWKASVERYNTEINQGKLF